MGSLDLRGTNSKLFGPKPFRPKLSGARAAIGVEAPLGEAHHGRP